MNVRHSLIVVVTALLVARCGLPARAQAAPTPGISRQTLNDPRSPSEGRPFIRLTDSRYLQLVWTTEGYEKTGQSLVMYHEGLGPAGVGDDLGIFYFVPTISRVLHLSVAHSVDLFLGGVVIFAFIIAIAGIWVSVRSKMARMFALIACGILILGSLAIGDVYVFQSSFAIATVPWILEFVRKGSFHSGALVWFLLLGLAAGLVNFIRIGAGSTVLLFLTVVVFAWRARNTQRATVIGAVFIGVVLSWFAVRTLVQQRDAYLRANGQQAKLAPHHVVWHTIYAGLGFLPNGFGLSWNDSVPIAKVRSIDPNAAYLSPEYEHVLRRATLAFIAANPGFVIETLLAKLGVVVTVFVAFTNVGLLAAVRHPKPRPVELGFVLSLTFSALPSVLAVPHASYMLGFAAMSALYGVVSLEYVSAQQGKRRPEIGNTVLNFTSGRERKECLAK